jgi:D-glycero-alpha-D-manno-heptose 1-phosphate guanylyltransferase
METKMEAVILAGGFGTRLSSRLTDLPKALAPVAGRPFLVILLDQLAAAGIGRVILSVGHLRHTIVEAIGGGYGGIPIHYAVEETPLGTGGAIRAALQQAKEDAVLVLNGDTYLDADYASMLAVHAESGRGLTIAIKHVDNMSRYGGLVVDQNQATGFIEKGRSGSGWINAGAYALNRSFLWPDSLPERFSFESDILEKHMDRIRPSIYRCEGYFLDIGIPEDLDRAQVELRDRSSNYRTK